MKLFPLLFCGITFSLAYFSNQDKELAKSIARGKEIYVETCIACHMGKGEGVKNTFPPLAKADYLLNSPTKAIASIKFGLKGKIMVNGVIYEGMMPSPNIGNDEIADVMNYILNSWGNSTKQPMITEKMVEAVKK
ncbi:c-type cytochrome [Pedobacter insulae]|uniref:Cytochrome c n=1 Tax=Pedobacter insulae TaxID=414048 RepID=A0A1I2WRA8_9SPHI|nr:cytochrome c [Pedobacter insulae]SFH03795.1 Cytochrome c [Pedobacter insulae]